MHYQTTHVGSHTQCANTHIFSFFPLSLVLMSRHIAEGSSRSSSEGLQTSCSLFRGSTFIAATWAPHMLCAQAACKSFFWAGPTFNLPHLTWKNNIFSLFLFLQETEGDQSCILSYLSIPQLSPCTPLSVMHISHPPLTYTTHLGNL